MNAGRHAELRAEALNYLFGAGGPVVLGLLDEIAELRRGLERVARDENATDEDWDTAVLHPATPTHRVTMRHSQAVAGATLYRADAIGDGE